MLKQTDNANDAASNLGEAEKDINSNAASRPKKHQGLQLLRFIFEMIAQNPKELFITLILSVIGTLAQVSLAFYLFRLFQSGGESINFLNQEITGTVLWVIPVALALTAAIVPYASERYIISKTVLFFKQSIQEIGFALGSTATRYALFNFANTNGTLTRLMSSDARYASLAFAGILRLIFPLTVFSASFAALIVLNWKWTGILVLLVSPFIFWQFKVIASGATLNRNLRLAGTEHGRRVTKFVGAVSTNFTANRWGSLLIDKVPSFITDDFPDAYGARLRLGISTRLIGDFALAGIILALCGLVLTNQFNILNLSNLLIFAILTRFALSNLSRSVSGTILLISQLPFYENFLAARKTVKTLEEAQLKTKKLESEGKDLNSPPPKINPPFDLIKHSHQVAFYSSETLNWPLIYKVLVQRSGRAGALLDINRSFLVTGVFQNFTDEFSKELQLSAVTSEAIFMQKFPESRHRWPDFETALETTDNLKENWPSISRSTKFLASLFYAIRKVKGGAFVFINGADFLALTNAEKVWVKASLKKAYIIIVFNRTFAPHQVPELSQCFFVDSTGKLYYIGSGDNVADIAEKVAPLLKKDTPTEHIDFDYFE